MSVCTKMIVQKIKSTRIYCEQEFALDWLMEILFN